MVGPEGGPVGDYVNPYHRAWQCQADSDTTRPTPDRRKLVELLKVVEDPVIGLEKVVEWWPGPGEREVPVYTCQICDGWFGWAGDGASHLTGDRHRRNQLVSRYSKLEQMIKEMESPELLERAREEERKLGRRYEVLQVVVDVESYAEFYEKLENKPFRGTQSASNRGQYPGPPPPGPRGLPAFSRPPPPAPRPRGHLLPPPFCRPPPLLPPVNVPPPMNFPPPPPPFRDQVHPDNREHFGPIRGQRGHFPRGGPPPRGGFAGGRGSQQQNQRGHYPVSGNISSHREHYPPQREDFEPRRGRREEEYRAGHQEHFVRRKVYEERMDYGLEEEYPRERQSLERRQERYHDEPKERVRGRQSQRSSGSERNITDATEERRSQPKSSQRPSHSRRRPDRDRRPRRRREEEEEEDLPEACYAVSADQEELDTENNFNEGKRKRRAESERNRPYDDYYAQYHEKSRRSITRFYESKQEKRKKMSTIRSVEPYEGPTIFDKVFRTKRKGEEDGGPGGERSEKQIDKEMEKEWRRYKEQSEERIRREKQKLQRYEKKLQEIQGDQSKKRSKPDKSPPRAYGGRAAYSSSDSDREPSPGPASPASSPGLSNKSKSEGEADRCQTKFDPY